MYGILLRLDFRFSLLRQLYTVGHEIFLYGRFKQLFVSELNHAYFSRHLF